MFGHADREASRRVEPFLQDALSKHADDTAFLFSLATWRLVEERNEDAIVLLRKVLVAEPRHLMALNNLATALGQSSATGSEASELIDRAIAQAGPLAELLDTKGPSYWSRVMSRSPLRCYARRPRSSSDPRHFFHLALALRHAGNLPESREALQQAKKLALNSAVLTPK